MWNISSSSCKQELSYRTMEIFKYGGKFDDKTFYIMHLMSFCSCNTSRQHFETPEWDDSLCWTGSELVFSILGLCSGWKVLPFNLSSPKSILVPASPRQQQGDFKQQKFISICFRFTDEFLKKVSLRLSILIYIIRNQISSNIPSFASISLTETGPHLWYRLRTSNSADGHHTAQGCSNF